MTHLFFGSTVEKERSIFYQFFLVLANEFLAGQLRPLLLCRSRPLFFILPGFNMVCMFHVARVIFVSLVLFCPSFLNLSSFSLSSTFVTVSFLLCGVVSPKPNPQLGGPGYPFLSGSSTSICVAREALSVAMLLPA